MISAENKQSPPQISNKPKYIKNGIPLADKVSPQTHSGNDSIHTTVTHFQAIERGTFQNAKADKPQDPQFI